MNRHARAIELQNMMRRRGEEIAALAADYKSVRAIADHLSATGDPVSAHQLYQMMVRAGIERRQQGGNHSAHSARAREARKERATMMAALYRQGYTLEQIGAQYGITRERVRQIITGDFALTAKDGGASFLRELKQKEWERRAEARCVKKNGCSREELESIRAVGREALAQGLHEAAHPIRAFTTQRCNARRRGIGWELSLWEWWQIWQQSGKWKLRGRGQGYVMARDGDAGPYAVGNVFITTAADNSSNSPRKKRTELPCGVRPSKNKKGGYYAQRNRDGKRFVSKTYPTPELAYAAYLMLGEQQQAA